MINKKILLLIAGMFFILIFSSVVNSATKEVEVNWIGELLDWCQDVDDHDVERCGYGYGNIQYSCNENDECPEVNGVKKCVCGGSLCPKATNGDFYAVVYSNYWYSAKCKESGQGADDHFANNIGSYNNADELSEFYTISPTQGAIAVCSDIDGDGYYSSVYVTGINKGVDYLCGNSESAMCDTNNPSVQVETAEVCDGLDNDCDGSVDEGGVCVTVCADGDGDGYGNPGQANCPNGAQTDCNPSYIGINPGATEIIGNNIDENCDGIIAFPPCADTDGDGWVSESQCEGSFGIISNFKGFNDCDNSKGTVYPGAPEICDGIDNQCEGASKADENPDSICATAGKICRLGSCVFPRVYWAENPDGTGEITTSKIFPSLQKTYLVLENFPIEAASWGFEIYEDDSAEGGSDDSIITGNNKLTGTLNTNKDKIIATWNIVQGDINNAQSNDNDENYNFYFIASGFKPLAGTFSGDFSGTWKRNAFGQEGAGTWIGQIINGQQANGIWEKVQTNLEWRGTSFDVSSNKIVFIPGTWAAPFAWFGSRTWESDDGISSGTWEVTTEEDEIAYDYKSSDLKLGEITGGPTPIGACGDGNRDSGEECDDGNTNPGDGCSSTCATETFCSTNSDCQTDEECSNGFCISTTPVTIDCSPYSLCSQITTSTNCDSTSTSSIASQCSLGPQNINCNDPNIDCGCSWNTGTTSCNSFFISTSDPLNSGTCAFQEDTTDDCTDGFLEYSWTASWSPSETTPSTECKDGSQSIMCSSKTKLPLENKYGIILTIIAIIGIYSFWFFRKQDENDK